MRGGEMATRRSDSTEIAYVAGLFDGEGDCRIQPYRATKNGARYLRVVARIHNTDRRCLDKVKEIFGYGWVGLSYRAGAHKRALRDCYQFVVTNTTAQSFLLALRPFLVVKAEKVDEILSSRNAGREIAA